MRNFRLAMFGLAALAACGGESRSTAGIAVRDSSGVAIVDHDSTALRKAPQFTAGATLFTMGGASADSMHNAARMYQAVLLGGGKFVTLDGRGSRIVLFDSSGAVLASWGKHGVGAGAVNAPSGLRLMPDGNIQLVDYPARILRFTTTDLALAGDSKIGGDEPVLATLMQQTSPSTGISVESEAGQGSANSKQYLVRVRRDGVDTLTSWRGDDPSRYGRRALAHAWGQNIVVAGEGWRFLVHDTTGAVKQEVIIHQAERPVTQAMRDSSLARDQRQIEAASAADKEAFMEMMKSVKFADSVAAFEDIVEGRGGNLWVAEAVLAGDSDRFYAVFDSSGKLVKRVKLAAKQKLLAADGDVVLVRWLDEKNAGHLDLIRLAAVPAEPIKK